MPPFLQHILLLGLISSAFLAVFLAIVFLRAWQKSRRAHLILCLLMLALGASVALNWYFSHLRPVRFPGLTSIPEPFLLLIGPLFYEYILRLNGGGLRLWRSAVHILPFVVVVGYLIKLFTAGNADPSFRVVALIWLGIYLHYWVYYFLNRRQLAAYRENMKDMYSSLEMVYQTWILFCLRTLLVCYSMLGVLFALQHGRIFLPINLSLAIILAITIYVIAYYILTRPELFTGSQEPSSRDGRRPNADNGVPAALARRTDLVSLMEAEKPYTDPSLDLSALAEMAGMSPQALSHLINTGLGSNFYEFVNGYRLEEAKRLLMDPANQHKTIIALAYDAGFNSKATFNRMFRKHTGTTPSDYREQAPGLKPG